MNWKLVLAAAASMVLIACAPWDKAPNGDSGNGGSGNGGGGQGLGAAFDGVMEKFQAEYVSPLSGRLRPGEYLAYRFEIWANTLSKGTIQLFECQDSSCSLRAPKYKMICNFNLLTCRLIDGNGQDVRRGGTYKADGNEVGEIQVEGNCGRFTNGTYKQCAYVTLVDPFLKKRGFNQRFLGADFVPENGKRTELKRFHIRD